MLIIVLIAMIFLLCFKRSNRLLLVCISCSLLVCLSTWCWKSGLKIDEDATIQQERLINVQPDSIKVNGDLVTFVGESPEKHQKFACRINIATEEEQKFWQTSFGNMTLTTSGTIEKASTQRNLNGFDYQLYLHASGIAGTYKISQYQQSEKIGTTPFLQLLRRKLLLHTDNVFPKKTIVYIKALILGFRDSEFEEVREIFSSTGLLHLFSLSGLHVQLFLGGIYYSLRRSRLTVRESLVPLTLIGVALYHLTGGSVSVTRALTYFLVCMMMRVIRYHCSSLDKFSISLILLLLLKPYTLFSLSGLLSVGISFIIIILSELQSAFPITPIRIAFYLQLVMIPLVSAFFFELPPFSGILGLVFIPVFQYLILPLSFCCFCLSFLPFLWTITEMLTQVLSGLISLIEHVVQLFSKATIPASANSSSMLFLLFLASIYFLQTVIPEKKIWKIICCLLLLCLPIYQKYLNPFGMIAFVDVGQGDSVFFKAPFSEETVLIDTGGQLDFERKAWQKRQKRAASDYNLVPFLKSQGVGTLNKLVLTHADEDHMGEAVHLAQKIRIKELYIAEGIEKNPKMFPILQQMIKTGTKIILVKSGDKIGDTFHFEVLYPDEVVEGNNNDSLVLLLDQQNTRFLFTGDLEEAGEKKLIEKYPGLEADVLKVGHHGSRTSSSPEFVSQVSPDKAIISCGVDNRFGHPHQETLENLSRQEIYRTDEQGMIYYTWSFSRELRLNWVVK